MNIQQFLSAVLDLIRGNYPIGNPDGLLAARLGVILRQAFPNVNWTSFGFIRLKDLLAELESQGKIRVGPNRSGAFSIWLPDEPTNVMSVVAISGKSSSWPRLRQEVWYAFISDTPSGRRFLDKNTGAVRIAVSTKPNEEGEWVEIQSVRQDTQRLWAREFLATQAFGDPNQFDAMLAGEDWYRRLAEHLSQQSESSLAAWNRLRTQNTIGIARAWCDENSVEFERLLEQDRQHAPRQVIPTASPQEDTLRSALFVALRRMTTPELMELPIRAKYLIQALRPDLVAGLTHDGAEA